MRTVWHYWVETYQNGKAGCSSGSEGPSLDAALAKAFQVATYYLLECGYNVTVTLETHCAGCYDAGTIRGKRGKQFRCPECKGKPPEEKIGPFPAVLHENVAHAVVA